MLILILRKNGIKNSVSSAIFLKLVSDNHMYYMYMYYLPTNLQILAKNLHVQVSPFQNIMQCFLLYVRIKKHC